MWILGSHNSWSYLPVKKWWMKPIAFTARCQNKNILEQYNLGVRCFDLRIRFEKGKIIFAHGIIEYDFDFSELWKQFGVLNENGDCYVRVLHEVRNEEQYTYHSIDMFKITCSLFENAFSNIKFWCGRNLYNWNIDYEFKNNPSCEEKYSSVCPPKILDDWFPWMYAKLNNKKIVKQGTDKDILLIDFINYGY